MKLNTQVIPVESNVENAISTFSIKTTAKAFKILSDGLYTDKILAFVRELGRNAYDAHIAAGRINVPFEIHLPNMLEPFFHVKDFGIGLSHDNVMRLYTTYFESTKSDSNDFVGALGLGSKSPFSYTNSFTVKSRYDNVESTYTCFLSEAGTPSIVLMGTGEYEGYSGLEVTIPIANTDFSLVREAVRKDLFYWEGTLPNVIGDQNFKLTPLTKSIVSKNWYVVDKGQHRGNYANVMAVQGNVGYPVDLNLIQQKYKTIKGAVPQGDETVMFNVVSQLAPVLQFEIGKLDVTASREALSYDDPTILNIIQRIREVAAEFFKGFDVEIAKVIKDSKTEVEFRRAALKLFNNYESSYRGFKAYYKQKNPKITWNKKEFLTEQVWNQQATFVFEGFIPFNVIKAEEKYSRYAVHSSSITKNPIGEVFISDRKVTSQEVLDFIHTDSYGALRGTKGGKIRWYDQSKVALPRKMGEARDAYGRYQTTIPKIYETTVFGIRGMFDHSQSEPLLVVNDLKGTPNHILARYLDENDNKAIYLIDYNKKNVTPAQVKKFTDSILAQVSGVTIKNLSQLVLKTPIVKPPRAAPKPRNINNVRLFTTFASSNVTPTTNLRYKAISSVTRSDTSFSYNNKYTEGTPDTSVDFTKGNFYYFVDYRNHFFLNEVLDVRVTNAQHYLNAINELGLIPKDVTIVAIRPSTLEKVKKSKKLGYLKPISELDKEGMIKIIADNPEFVTARKIQRIDTYQLRFGPNSQALDILNGKFVFDHINNTYGDVINRKTKSRFLNSLSELFKVANLSEDLDIRKKFSILETIKYYTVATRVEKNAYDIMTTKIEPSQADIKMYQQKLNETLQTLTRDYPLLNFITADEFRYGGTSTAMNAKRISLIDELVSYTLMVDKKHGRNP